VENKTVDKTKRWLDFSDSWKSAGGKDSPSPVYINLLERYSETHRHYHDLSHVNHCLDELKTAEHLAVNSMAVKMAIWFHDAVCDPSAKDNEEKSAELAKTILKKASLSAEFTKLAVNLILATKHSVPPTDPDEKLITDIDLSSLFLIVRQSFQRSSFMINTKRRREETSPAPSLNYQSNKNKYTPPWRGVFSFVIFQYMNLSLV